jgi:hypothetical protein
MVGRPSQTALISLSMDEIKSVLIQGIEIRRSHNDCGLKKHTPQYHQKTAPVEVGRGDSSERLQTGLLF